jgi:hypothetical protein
MNYVDHLLLRYELCSSAHISWTLHYWWTKNFTPILHSKWSTLTNSSAPCWGSSNAKFSRSILKQPCYPDLGNLGGQVLNQNYFVVWHPPEVGLRKYQPQWVSKTLTAQWKKKTSQSDLICVSYEYLKCMGAGAISELH